MTLTVCIDFDGVIHSYTSPWGGPTVIQDPPVKGAFDFIGDCLSTGYDVAITSVRSSTQEGREAMAAWFLRHGFTQIDRISFPEHKPPADIYIDDRAYCFTGTYPSMALIKNFRPWNRGLASRRQYRLKSFTGPKFGNPLTHGLRIPGKPFHG